jgi:hypothetical protein
MPTGGDPAGQLSRRLAAACGDRFPARAARPRATVPVMDQREGDVRMTDLLTVGLVVFFVSLLVLVAALLFLPSVV